MLLPTPGKRVAMPLYEPTIPYRYAAPLLDIILERAPGRVGEIRTAVGLGDAASEPADSTLTMARFDQLLALASERLQRADLGFELGRRIAIETHAPLASALASCSTLEEILRLMERYYHLVTPAFSARYLPGERFCEWRIRVVAAMSQATLHMLLEMHAVAIHGDLTRMFGMDGIFDIHLSAPPPPHSARYERLPCTRFHFSSEPLPEVRCVIPTELLKRRLARRAGTLAAGGGNKRPGARASLQAAQQYGGWVELMLLEAQTLQPTVRQLAELLNMSARSLARKLSAEGINFRELSSQIRGDRARAMLSGSALPLPQIAYQLGYSDTTAFIRSFRRLTGMTPARYRSRGA